MSEQKVILFVKSVKISPTLVDQYGGVGPCNRGTGYFCVHNAVMNLEDKQGRTGHYYPEKDWNAMNIAKKVAETEQLEVEFVDLGISFWKRLKYRFLQLGKTPRFIVNGEKLPEISTTKELINYLKK
ncbi:MAG: hypothetical protein ACFFB2_10525 [Promethearchaeota archaeon]